jgi:hypothetical protein
MATPASVSTVNGATSSCSGALSAIAAAELATRATSFLGKGKSRAQDHSHRNAVRVDVVETLVGERNAQQLEQLGP